MWRSISRSVSFTLGLALLLLGTIQLYAGLQVANGSEDYIANTVSALVALFPGAVFLTYAFRSANSEAPSAPSSELLTTGSGIAAESDGVVIPFPGTPAIKPYSQVTRHSVK